MKRRAGETGSELPFEHLFAAPVPASDPVPQVPHGFQFANLAQHSVKVAPPSVVLALRRSSLKPPTGIQVSTSSLPEVIAAEPKM